MKHLFKSKMFLFIVATVLVFVALVASSRAGLSLGYVGDAANVVYVSLRKVVMYPADVVGSWKVYVVGVEGVKKENEALKLKVGELEAKSRELDENRAKVRVLEQMLGMKDSTPGYDLVGANVIAGDMGNWFNVFVIDAGKNSQIHDDLCVTTSQGLVGKTVGCTATSSKVVSILDSDSAVSARVTKTRDMVMVKGETSLQKEGLCRVDYIPPDAEVQAGDIVETSGLGGIFPKGIIIGKITMVEKKADGVLTAILKPTVDFAKLEQVSVMRK